VAITHQNVVRLFGATEDLFRFDAQDVWTVIPFFRIRLLGLGDLGCTSAWRPIGDRPYSVSRSA